MKQSISWSIWRCATSPRSGRCRSVIGSPHSIALPSNLKGGFLVEQAVGRVPFPGLFELEDLRTQLYLSCSCLPAWYTDPRKSIHRIVQMGKKSLPEGKTSRKEHLSCQRKTTSSFCAQTKAK